MCKDQKGAWCKLLVKKNGTIRVQHLKPYDLGCCRCHKLKWVKISEAEQARIFDSFMFLRPLPFLPCRSSPQWWSKSERNTTEKTRIFFVQLFTLMNNHQENCFLTISYVKFRQRKRSTSMKIALGAECLRALFPYLLYPNPWHIQFRIQVIKDSVPLKILARHTILLYYLEVGIADIIKDCFVWYVFKRNLSLKFMLQLCLFLMCIQNHVDINSERNLFQLY